ncbi:MAG: DedA family protein [Selenomonas sp.]|nr:DedA family protein [Selenomonas sp.]
MEQFSTLFLEFIASWGYVAVAILMAAENACIPIPSELILGFAGYLIFADQMTFTGALVAGMVGGMAGSIFAYVVGHRGGRSFVDKYGHYFFVKKSHVDIAQNWFDKYGLKAVFFSRMLPVVRTFISLPAGFAHVDMKKFLTLTFLGSLPWTALILAAGMMLGKSWEIMLKIGHQASLIFVGVCAVIIVVMYLRYRKRKQAQAKMEIE